MDGASQVEEFKLVLQHIEPKEMIDLKKNHSNNNKDVFILTHVIMKSDSEKKITPP